MNDYPIEQYVSDAKIDTLYEGTTAIQGQDLFFRKIIRDKGRALGVVSSEIEEFLATEGPLVEERKLLARGLQDAGLIIAAMTAELQKADPRNGGDPKNLYKVGLNTTRMLMALGDMICAYLLIRAGEVAAGKLDGAKGADVDFYAGKIASAKFFAATYLPKLTAERKIAEGVTLDLMELPESAF